MKNLLLFTVLAGGVLSAQAATKEKAKAKPSTSAAATAAAAGDQVKVDTAASVVNWKGAKVTGAHNGKIKIKEGSLNWKGTELVAANIVIDMSSISCDDLTDKSYNDKLIGHFKSDDFFSTEKFPTSTFKLSSVKAITAADGNTHEVTGDLTIKGQTQPITFPAKIESKEGVTTALATLKVDRTKYGIKYGSGKFFENLGDKMIDDNFEISFNLSAKK